MQFTLADLNGRNVGEPRATSRSVSVGMSKVESASFTIRDIDPLWEQIAAGESMLKVYNSADELCLYGPVIADQEEAGGQGAKVVCTAADMSWRLGRRYIGKDTTNVGTTYTATDSGTIVYNALAAVNAEEDTGITAGTKDTFVTRTVTFLWKPVLDIINELGSISSSYEWTLRYVDGTPPIAYLDLRTQLGTDKTTSLFLEYGTGLKNCKGYSRVRTIEALATDVWAVGGGSTITAYASDAAARAAYKRHEDVINYGDITVTSLLDAVVSAHIAFRRYPRTMINLTPFPKTAPKYGVDWVVGDIVSARVMIRNRVRASGNARIWGASIEVSDTGEEIPTLQLAPD
jgi:hypothetical protein